MPKSQTLAAPSIRRRSPMVGRQQRCGRQSSDSPDSTPEGLRRNMSELLGHIRGYYKEALDRLPVEEMPAVIPSLLAAGFCFGFLDPVSNIVANTIAVSVTVEAKKRVAGNKKKMKKLKKMVLQQQQQMKKSKKRKRSLRETAFSQICGSGEHGIAQRSLDGLLSFLLAHFRYLPPWDGLRYLRIAKADLLVAARLIELDRQGAPITLTISPSTTTKVALKCAALSARHLDPASAVATTLSLASRLDDSQVLRSKSRLSRDAARQMHKLLFLPVGQVSLQEPLQLATLRLQHERTKNKMTKAPLLGSARSLRCLLLDKIHCVYLKAIARIPVDALRRSHHRGLLKAGHCYGPMHDPVSNILLNTVWYDAAFPAQRGFEADMLCTNSLVRIECRSCVGLVAFLCSLFPALAEHGAMVFLLRSDASLHQAIDKAQQEGYNASGSFEAAYKLAAEVAWHPDPGAQVEFFAKAVRRMPPAVLSLQRIGHILSYNDVDCFVTSLLPVEEYQSMPDHQQVPKLTSRASYRVSCHQGKFEHRQLFLRSKVEAALKEFSQQSGGPEYELHIICGVNKTVPRNRRPGFYGFRRRRYPYSHINFWAKPRGTTTAPSVLFFVECRNGDKGFKEHRPPLCCHVVDPSTDAGRCFHCERDGTKIVHPALGRYHGCDRDFEEMALDECEISDEGLIISGNLRTGFLGVLEDDDSVYFDPGRDSNFAQFMNEVSSWTCGDLNKERLV